MLNFSFYKQYDVPVVPCTTKWNCIIVLNPSPPPTKRWTSPIEHLTDVAYCLEHHFTTSASHLFNFKRKRCTFVGRFSQRPQSINNANTRAMACFGPTQESREYQCIYYTLKMFRSISWMWSNIWLLWNGFSHACRTVGSYYFGLYEHDSRKIGYKLRKWNSLEM